MTDRDLARAHAHASNHRKEVLGGKGRAASTASRGFRRPQLRNGLRSVMKARRAPCPVCSIDSVIGDKSGFH